MSEQQPLGALVAVLRGSAVPYGYTLTVWATHGLLTNQQGNPGVEDLVLFVVGAMLAFALLGFFAERVSAAPLKAGRRDLIRAGTIHVFAIGAAFGAAALLATVPGAIAWALASFAASALYLSIASLEIVFAQRIDEPSRRG